MPRLGNINQYEKKKAQRKADAMPAAVPPAQEAITPQSQSVTQGFQQMGQMDVQQPVLQTKSPAELNQMYENTRKQALGHESNLADPEKAQEYWNASPYEYWTEQVKANPENTYAILNQMYASKETPEEKRKRERREQLGEVFNNLGNLIGNAANLYYAGKSGYSIDLNTANEKHRERMQRIKEKQDALKQKQDELLGKAKLSDVKAERDEKAAEKKRAADKEAVQLKFKQDLYLKELDNAYKMGQIDAQTKAKMAQDAAKAKTDKELEAIRHSNRMTLKQTPSYGQNDIVESFADTNGVVWTRTKPFSKAEKAEFFESLPTEIQQMFTVEQYDDDGSVKSRKVDYDGALGYAINQGRITNPEERGFKKGKSSAKEGSEGFSFSSKQQGGFSFK